MSSWAEPPAMLRAPRHRPGKRLFDLALAGLGLVVLAPLMLACALWVKLDSKGPVLFKQTRVGQGGKPFTLLKLRTMRVNAAPSGPSLTVGNDARITHSGTLLRRLRLDELPQLLNVLAGQMSIVGPRPEVPRYVAHFPSDLGPALLAHKPGLTDPTSLALRHESRLLARASDAERYYIHTLLPRKLRLSLAYAERATLCSDAWVVLRTVGVLLGR